MKVPIIKCKRITLRPLSVKDANIFISWFRDKEVTKYLILQKAPSLRNEIKWIKDRIKSKENYVWSMLNENNQLVGNIDIRYNYVNHVGNFGIVIGDKQSWGLGYGAEAFEAIIAFAFKKLKCNRVDLFVYSGNWRAKKL
jgi:RimJ/RimL family protein N-acetyltransferase